MLLECYSRSVAGGFDDLEAPDRHREYKMLRVEAADGAHGSLDVSGDVMSVCETETLST